MQDAIYHCHDTAYPLQFDTCHRHCRPLMPWYHLACYHWICSMQRVPRALNAQCIEYSQVSCSRRIIFLLSSLDVLHEYYTCWVDSQKITWLFRLKRHRDGCEMLERHRRTQCWPAPSITHAEQMTQFSPPLSSSGWVYQCCPEYLTGKRAHPWDLICTGVHLVEVVWDNLHIMSHLHPGARKTSRSLRAECAAPATSEADGLFADTVAKTSVCCANPRGS